MGFKVKGAAIGSAIGGLAMGPLGLVGGAYLGGKFNTNNPNAYDPVAAEKSRYEGMLNEDNLKYLEDADKKRYQDFLNQSVAPQDALGFFKSKADELEALISNKKERSKAFFEQLKIMAERPGASQLKNVDVPLLSNKTPSLLPIASAQAASQNGGILSR